MKGLIHRELRGTPNKVIVTDLEGNAGYKEPGEFGSSAKRIKHADLRAAVAAGTLAPGTLYTITDFQTKHIIQHSAHLNVQGTVYVDKATAPNTLVEGVEELTVLALTANKVSQQAYSSLYPQDLINYDLDAVLCEDNLTPRPGKITYRKDMKANVELHYDWRNVRFIRYKIAPAAYDAVATYAANSLVMYAGVVYVCLLAGTVGVTPSNAATNYNWAQVYRKNPGLNTFDLHIAQKATGYKLGRWACAVDAASFRHVWTFNAVADVLAETVTNAHAHANVFNVSIARGGADNYNNIVHIGPTNTGVSFFNVTIEGGCSEMTFLRRGAYLSIGATGANNLFVAALSESRIANWSGDNILMDDAGYGYDSTSFADGFRGNVMHAGKGSSFMNLCTNNIFKGSCLNSQFGNAISGVTAHGQFNSNVLSASGTDNSVFRDNVNQVALTANSSGSTWNGALSKVTVAQQVLNRTITAALTDTTIALRSPAGKLFAQSVDEMGVVVTKEVV